MTPEVKPEDRFLRAVKTFHEELRARMADDEERSRDWPSFLRLPEQMDPAQYRLRHGLPPMGIPIQT